MSNTKIKDLLIEKDDLLKMKHVSKKSKYFIMNSHEKVSKFRRRLGTFKDYRDLEPIQKLKLEFMKFNDRPIYQRIGLGTAAVLVSTKLNLHISRKIIKSDY